MILPWLRARAKLLVPAVARRPNTSVGIAISPKEERSGIVILGYQPASPMSPGVGAMTSLIANHQKAWEILSHPLAVIKRHINQQSYKCHHQYRIHIIDRVR